MKQPVAIVLLSVVAMTIAPNSLQAANATSLQRMVKQYLFALLVVLQICLASVGPALALPASASKELSAAETAAWREDLRYLAAELPRRHKNLFHRTSPAEFESAVQSLDARIPLLERHEIIVEFARIVSLARDGHTGMRGLLYDSPAKFRHLPLAMYHFKDGLFIYAADPKYASVVGGRVVRIGNASVEQAVQAVTPLIPRDNDMAVKERAPLYLAAPEVLHALRIVENMERVSFVVEKEGQQVRIEVIPSPAPKPSNDNWALGQRFSKLDNWVDARSSAASSPLWLRDPTNYFWFTFLEDSNTLFAQFNDTANKANETVAQWVSRIEEVLRSRAVNRLVLDLRWNTGGNNYLNKPLLLALIKSKEVNQPGKLYAIIGRRNFSAAQNLVNDLDNYTNVIFVGEPTASAPNFFGDPTSIVLPNSKLVVGASTLWWQDADPRDKRQWTGPDLAVDMGFADYRSNRDPAMELILAHKAERPLTELMWEAFIAGNRTAVVRLYENYKADPVNAYSETETAVNSLGYRLLGIKKVSEAVTVFTLNAKSYPRSPNVYDSLAEAYLESGDKQRAIENYRKVLELDPGNASATEALRRIESMN